MSESEEAEEPTNRKVRNRTLSLVYSSASACDSDNAVSLDRKRSEQNIVIRSWRADQSFAEAKLISETVTNEIMIIAITKFKNCFIIRSPSLYSHLDYSLRAICHRFHDISPKLRHVQYNIFRQYYARDHFL